MSAIAILCLALSAGIIWGGLIASGVFLARHEEVDEYPPEDPAASEITAD
ncbi:MetS family NSS transporter small subunit [Leucobacter zeae]|nr:MetS family NSS transporter small subunit [Leucobacter zeae]